MARAADEVPIYEREMPTDPAELKKYLAELERALKDVETATRQESTKAIAAALAPQSRAVDVAIPERDEEQIRIASRRMLTEQTIKAEVADLLKQLRAGLDRESIADADRFIRVYPAKPVALANAAAIAWVQEAPGVALLLAAEAAQRAPGNPNLLNTLGSLLADAGYATRGIPILAYLAQKFPNDPTLLNNLGQAWLGLGAPELARPRLQTCLSRAPAHGAAHSAMGVIAYSAGDHAAAITHFQTAAASHGSPVARRALKRLDVGYSTPRSFLRAAPVQEYFNPRHFVPPTGQVSIAQAETKKAEIAQFTAMIVDRIKSAEAAMTEAGAKLEKDMGRTASEAFSRTIGSGAGATGFALAQASGAFEGKLRRALEFKRDLDQFTLEANALWEYAERQVAARREEFRREWAGVEIGEGGTKNAAFIAASARLCADCQGMMEAALPAIAHRYNDLVVQVSTRERVAINEELTYLPFIAGGDLYRREFYALVIGHLQRVGTLAGANPVRSYECGPSPVPGSVKPAEGDLPSPGPCPINLKVNLHVAKFKADCTSIGFEFEAGLKFSAKKSFKSGETTLKGGVGADLELGPLGQVEGNGQFVVVWDQGNSLSFLGVESSASASLSGIPGLSGTLDTGSGTSVTASAPTGTPDIVNVSSETTLGVTLGPRGVEPTLRGSAGAEVLGRDLVKAAL
jgi:tetratricopeptide (TPR) repeat protein